MTDGSPELDTTVPHSARVWNYWLGGEGNYPADRMVGDQVMAVFPDITRLARADRAFLGRAVRYLAFSDGTDTSAMFTEAVRHYNENSASTYHPRRPERIAGFFAGLELVAPGVVGLSRWRPDDASGSGPAEVPGVCGVGRKP